MLSGKFNKEICILVGEKMKQKGMKSSLVLVFAIIFFMNCLPVSAEENADISKHNHIEEYTNEMIQNNYTNVSAGYTTEVYDGDVIEIPIDTAYVKKSDGKLTSENANYKNDVVHLTIGDRASFVINVPETAQYYISFDYYAYSDSVLPVEFSLSVNGEIPFYEARNLIFESTWIKKDEKSYDRYGNEIVTVPDKLTRWENKFIMDRSYRYSTPLAIELEKGKNVFEIEMAEGSVLLGNIYLSGIVEIADYIKNEKAEGEELIVIEAEQIDYRNDSSIRPTYEYDKSLTPYDPSKKLLNVIDSASFTDAGQTITYEFNIDEPGYYYLGFAYRQDEKTDFPVFMDIKIDGEIPNKLMQSYPFEYTKNYKNLIVQDENGDPIAIYFGKGEHTLSLTINIDNIRNVLEALDRIIAEINDLALEITKVAGTNKDKYRDLDLVNYIPDIKERLLNWAMELDKLRDSVKMYNEDVDDIGAFSSIVVASRSLRKLAKEPNKIPYRIDALAQSTSSVAQYLANLIDILKRNALALDKIFIFQEDAELSTGRGFFEGTYLNTVRFLSSFTEQAYSISNRKKTHLQVWVNRSRQHVEVLQKMIDESFTPKTGIKVDVSLMPDQNKLIMANAAGEAPDVAQSINYSIPFELAIRGAIKDVTEFNDYQAILTRCVEGLHIPAMIGDGIYAVPETINFWVLYYRTDILDKLGLEVPETIEDVKEMLPELQIRGLNFYYPTAGMGSFKTFHGTTPLIFQYEGDLYEKTAMNTTINNENAVKGFTELTELFTIYNLPVDVPNFYQHFRNGDIPIGIAEYGMYNLLINAAPEIANSWDIAVVPGVENEDEEVLRYTSGGAESCVIFKSNEERERMAWEYLKWWTSTDVQVEYGQILQTTYGDEYIWNTANMDAFAQLPWDAKHKKVIMEQTEWLLEAPRFPGSYMAERELSNAYNAIVVDGDDLRITLNNAVKRINRETERKLKEFGYISPDGEVIEEYIVPTLDKVQQILYDE